MGNYWRTMLPWHSNIDFIENWKYPSGDKVEKNQGDHFKGSVVYCKKIDVMYFKFAHFLCDVKLEL